MPNRYELGPDEVSKILAAPRVQEVGFSCDADARDHVHVLRAGAEGSGLEGRGVLLVHEGESAARVFMAAPRLRSLAAALLNVADDLDGETRLNFFPATPDAHDPHDDEENDE